MRLAEALIQIDQAELEQIAAEVDSPPAGSTRAHLVSRLERTLVSPSHIEQAVMRRRPPVFGLLEALLESDGAMSTEGCREAATRVTEEVQERVDSGELAKGSGRDLYRRVLTEAWRSDLTIDQSEASILGVLRHELSIRQVEHFLLVHHREVRPFWSTEDAFRCVVDALRRSGVVFELSDQLVIPDELLPLVRNAVGLPLDSRHARRLFLRLTGSELRAALKAFGLLSSGSKNDQVVRLVDHFCSPVDVLATVHIKRIMEIAAQMGCKKSGAKSKIITRVIEWVATEKDLASKTEEEPLPPEPRVLSSGQFKRLLGELSGGELGSILWKRRDELPQSGANQRKVETIVGSRYSEETLLGHLDNRTLGELLGRVGAKRGGSKQEMIDRLLEHARTISTSPDGHLASTPTVEPAPRPEQRASTGGDPQVDDTLEERHG